MSFLKKVLRMVLVMGVAIGLVGISWLFYQEKLRQDVAFALAPDGKSIVFSTDSAGGSGLRMLDLVSMRSHDLTRSNGRKDTPAFSPDGHQIIYTAVSPGSTASHIYTYSLADQTRKRLTSAVGVYDDMASFSADGTQIVFARALLHRPYSMGGWTWDHWDIYAMRSDGTGIRRLTSGEYYMVSPPKFAPDGQTIVFAPDDSASGISTTNVLKVDLRGKKSPWPLTKDGHSSSPTFTPDGKHIIYISDATIPYDYELWSMDYDGTHPVQLTHEHSYLESPVVTRDGKHILVLADKNRAIRYDLYEFDIDGTHPRRVADNTLFDRPLYWKLK